MSKFGSNFIVAFLLCAFISRLFCLFFSFSSSQIVCCVYACVCVCSCVRQCACVYVCMCVSFCVQCIFPLTQAFYMIFFLCFIHVPFRHLFCLEFFCTAGEVGEKRKRESGLNIIKYSLSFNSSNNFGCIYIRKLTIRNLLLKIDFH